MSTRILVTLFLMMLSSANASPPAEQYSQWRALQSAMGQIRPNGTLRRSYALNPIAALDSLGLGCVLEHAARIDALGHPYSDWYVSTLQSYLAPEGRTDLLWKPPGMAPVHFGRPKHSGVAHAGDYTLVGFGSSDVTISSESGRRWRYSQGLLKELVVRDRHFEVNSQGGLLTAISAIDGSHRSPLIEAAFASTGKLVRLTIEGRFIHSFEWSDNQLRTWTDFNGVTTYFDYVDELLAAVRREGSNPETFSWACNRGNNRGDTRWLFPVHLCTDEERTYSYSLSQRGFHIEIHNRNGEEHELYFNPVTCRIMLKTNPDWVTFTFSSRFLSAATLMAVETKSGIIRFPNPTSPALSSKSVSTLDD